MVEFSREGHAVVREHMAHGRHVVATASRVRQGNEGENGDGATEARGSRKEGDMHQQRDNRVE
jgi:hypothetical protein